jgi:hypothetical protein
VPNNAGYSTKADYLRALTASWKYAADLDSAERDQYRDFERRLWRAWALARGWRDRRAGVPFTSAAGNFADNWKEGDERFVLRIFEEPATTIEEKNIAEHLAHLFSLDGIKKLQKIADGSSPKTPVARCALEEAVLRIFGEPHSTVEEINIAKYIASHLSPEGIKKIQNIADSTSSQAPAARRALEETKHIKPPQTEN